MQLGFVLVPYLAFPALALASLVSLCAVTFPLFLACKMSRRYGVALFVAGHIAAALALCQLNLTCSMGGAAWMLATAAPVLVRLRMRDDDSEDEQQ